MIATQNNSLYISKAYLQEEGYKASATVTFGANPVDGHNIVLNGTVFTYRDSPTVANDVQVGVDISTSIDNLLTEALPSVATYTKVGTDSIFIEYNTIGVVGNSYTIESNFTSVPSNLSGGSDTPDGDWVDNTPTVEYTPPEMYLEPTETTSTALVGYTPVAQGDAVRVYNATDGLVDGTLGTTTTTAAGLVSSTDPFGDGSLVEKYELDGNTNGTRGLYNGTATNVTYGAGKFGQAAVFNGSSSEIQTTVNINLNTTISFWIKPNGTLQRILGFYNGAYDWFTVQLRDTGELEVLYYGKTANNYRYYRTLNLNLSVNDFHNIQVTYNVDINTVVVNNTVVPMSVDASGGSVVNSDGTLSIGKVWVNSWLYLSGSIDQVEIYNKTLTPTEATALNTQQGTKYTSDITSLMLSNPPSKAWLDTPITVATCTESTLSRCIAQDTPLVVTGTPTLTTASGIGTMSGMLETGDSILADGVLVEPASIVETDLGGGTYKYDITFDPALAQPLTTIAIPDRSIYPAEASDTYDGTKFVKAYNKVEQQGRAFRYKIEGDERVAVSKLNIPFNKQP